MDWIALCVICMNVIVIQARHELNINKLIELIKRRYSTYNNGPILGKPWYPEDLPEAEPILPGHTLIRPSMGMLKSAVKFPLRDLGGSLVYGNQDNIGLANDENERVMYSDFRKSNDILADLADIIQASKHRRPLIVIARGPFNGPNKNLELESLITYSDEKNDGLEILDELDSKKNIYEESSDEIDFRRKKSHKKSHSKFRKRKYEDSTSSESSDSSSSDSSSSIESEKNPGNPYTLFKEKYKQNWAWNHFMDGDHMNVNPYAPSLAGEGPSGAELLLGRKWWYFNQDDYKPMG